MERQELLDNNILMDPKTDDRHWAKPTILKKLLLYVINANSFKFIQNNEKWLQICSYSSFVSEMYTVKVLPEKRVH